MSCQSHVMDSILRECLSLLQIRNKRERCSQAARPGPSQGCLGVIAGMCLYQSTEVTVFKYIIMFRAVGFLFYRMVSLSHIGLSALVTAWCPSSPFLTWLPDYLHLESCLIVTGTGNHQLGFLEKREGPTALLDGWDQPPGPKRLRWGDWCKTDEKKREREKRRPRLWRGRETHRGGEREADMLHQTAGWETFF